MRGSMRPPTQFRRLSSDSERKTRITRGRIATGRLQAGMLQVEQPSLKIETAAVPTQGPARCDHPVAGNDDSDWVSIVRHPDRAVRMRVANRFRDIAVTARLAVGNFEQSTPARELERRSEERRVGKEWR